MIKNFLLWIVSKGCVRNDDIFKNTVMDYHAFNSPNNLSNLLSRSRSTNLSLLVFSLALSTLNSTILFSFYCTIILGAFCSLRLRMPESLNSSSASVDTIHLFLAFLSSFLILVGVRDLERRMIGMLLSTSRSFSRTKEPYLFEIEIFC